MDFIKPLQFVILLFLTAGSIVYGAIPATWIVHHISFLSNHRDGAVITIWIIEIVIPLIMLILFMIRTGKWISKIFIEDDDEACA